MFLACSRKTCLDGSGKSGELQRVVHLRITFFSVRFFVCECRDGPTPWSDMTSMVWYAGYLTNESPMNHASELGSIR